MFSQNFAWSISPVRHAQEKAVHSLNNILASRSKILLKHDNDVIKKCPILKNHSESLLLRLLIFAKIIKCFSVYKVETKGLRFNFYLSRWKPLQKSIIIINWSDLVIPFTTPREPWA